MTQTRRNFFKATLLGTAAVVVAQQGIAGEKQESKGASVIRGKSNKKEITYKKTQAWDDYYKSAL